MLSFKNNLIAKVRSWAPREWFGFVVIISFVTRFIILMFPMRPMWDGTVYLGMARFLGSGGGIGYWELFRPPFWPLILTPFSWLGPDVLEWVARILVLVASLGILYFVYKLGEKVGPYAGVLAAALLAFSSPFLGYSVVPMTEIPSLFFVMATLYAFTERRFFLTGILAALTFLTRFPAVLVLVPVAMMFLYELILIRKRESFVTWLKQSAHTLIGFLVLVFVFLVANKVVYGNAFLPLIEGPKMIQSYLWLYGGDALFYVKKILALNPVTWFVIPACIFLIVSWKRFSRDAQRAILLVIVTLLTFLLYFSSQAHKELRYILPAYPFVFLMVSLGIYVLWDRVRQKGKLLIFMLVILAFWMSITGTQIFTVTKHGAAGYRDFYAAIRERGTTVLSNTPAIAASSLVRMIEGYNTWEHIAEQYTSLKGQYSHIVIDTCETHVCEPGSEAECKVARETFLATLHEETELVYDATIDSCHLTIHKTK